MKKIAKILPVLMVVVMVFTSVYANISVPTTTPSGTGSTTVKNAVGNIWATIVSIVQVLAIAAVVFAGLRYMFASADQKADIKKSMGTLAVGAVLVFGASTLLKFVSTTTGQVIK